ncbi:ABC transporter ATP-binding protein [Celeribacter ethanolicus]|uniref:ABC transporter ATP-binding protein n=1 Tax=Celeribacter ethanolicus TaxID=1758178 RepID=UPI0008373241|nr:ABC transporter ATP-binding protein [Celeribacter ethanolicus]
MTGLNVENITHDWGAKRALDGVSFSVAPGQFCALLGPNGAGKSTLFGLLTRLFTPRTGRIEMAGHDVSRDPLRALSKTGVVFQQPTLDLDLSVWRNMLYFAGLHGITGRVARSAASEALNRLGMEERARERVRDLNGGHRRRLEIARALMHRPEVLLLDEPTVGLDAQTRSDLVAHVHGLARDTGLAVLWATHLTDEIWSGDQLVVLHQGRVLEQGEVPVTGVALTEHFLRLTESEGA